MQKIAVKSFEVRYVKRTRKIGWKKYSSPTLGTGLLGECFLNHFDFKISFNYAKKEFGNVINFKIIKKDRTLKYVCSKYKYLLQQKKLIFLKSNSLKNNCKRLKHRV